MTFDWNMEYDIGNVSSRIEIFNLKFFNQSSFVGVMTLLSQPYFEKSVRMRLTLLNGNLGVYQDSRNFKVQLQGSKHLTLRHFLYHWKAIKA